MGCKLGDRNGLEIGALLTFKILLLSSVFNVPSELIQLLSYLHADNLSTVYFLPIQFMYSIFPSHPIYVQYISFPSNLSTVYFLPIQFMYSIFPSHPIYVQYISILSNLCTVYFHPIQFMYSIFPSQPLCIQYQYIL